MVSDRIGRLRLLLFGLAAGDALGSTVEFESVEQIPGLYQQLKSRGWPFRQIGGGAFDWTPGEATDDTDMAIGRDADTYGAIAGPLIAAVHGVVPAELTEGLEVLSEIAGLTLSR